MEGLDNMGGEFEGDILDMLFDWNDDNFVPTFLESDTAMAALQDLNLMENFNFQTEVAPVNPSAVMESIDGAQTQVQPTDPTSWFSQGPSSSTAFTFVPNPLPPPPPPTPSVLDGTLLSNSLSTPGLMLDGEGPSFRGQDLTQNVCENVFAFQGLDFNGEQNLSNQLSAPNTVEINNFNGFNVNQSSSVQVKPANETYSSGLFALPQRPAFVPLQNHIGDSHAAWNSSRPQHTEFSSSDIRGAQYAPNFMQSFSTVQNQVGHSSELRHIHGLQSQNSTTSFNSMYPRSEPYSNVDTASVRMPTIPYQQGYRTVLPKPAVPSMSSLTNFGQQPNLFATSNAHGSGSSMPPTNQMYSQFRDQRHHPQVTMPNIQGQQSGASMQQWSKGMHNHISKYNQRMNTPNLRRPSNTSSWVSQASSSRVPISREPKNIAPALRIQEEATVGKNEVRTSRDKGTLQRTSSSTTSEPSDAIRRILDMNPSRLVRNSIAGGQYQGSNQSGRVRYEPPSRGRPPKRRFEEYFQRQKVISEIGNSGTTPTSRQALHIPYSYRNATPSNSPSVPRKFVNSIYDIGFERKSHPMDPHRRLFKPEN